MIYSTLSSIKLKVDLRPKVDSFVFLLHYRYTNLIFMVSALLSTLYDAVGKKIDCMATGVSTDVVNEYCFIMGTFTVDRLHGLEVGVDVPHPGVGPLVRAGGVEEEITVHSYYQWVPFVLFLQGLFFYFPHWIWKRLEGGFFREVIQDISVKDYLGANLKIYFNREERFKALVQYITNHMDRHTSWAGKFFFCELLNLAVVVSMLFFTDAFLGGEFLTYGSSIIEIASLDPENRTDPMSLVFPKMAKCTFKSFGASGTIQIKDVMCLIATNIINEKIYLFLWVWLVLLTAITAIWSVYRVLTIMLPFLRTFILRMYVKEGFASHVSEIMHHASLSDWYLLVSLGRNMEESVFSEFVAQIAAEYRKSTDTIAMDELEKKPLNM
ncbi:innexin inx2-like [Palaemon carinicauda]|uniref:innexin inx2-like n=1 Tax=Palaemon carinicauda TaxID=392227 RepID=UPI0035B571CE